MGGKAGHCYIIGGTVWKYDLILLIDSHSDGVSTT